MAAWQGETAEFSKMPYGDVANLPIDCLLVFKFQFLFFIYILPPEDADGPRLLAAYEWAWPLSELLNIVRFEIWMGLKNKMFRQVELAE